MPASETDRTAIIGMAGCFPGAPDTDTFWRNLVRGRECITRLSERELLEEGADPALLHDPGFVPAKGVLEGADRFDPAFFGHSPREAQLMDPQHRVFLEQAWQALENAGYVPGRFPGRIGVFAGAGLNSYLLHNVLPSRMADSVGMYQVQLGSDKDFLATRVAYKLGLTGPALTVQTACSTSLTAVHLAVQSLLNGECDIALAGGVAVSAPLRGGYRYEPGGVLSPDGSCRPFDAEAAGTVPGNGAGVVVLRRLEEAVRDGDAVDAVVLGSAVNNDGSLKAGYTAPSAAMQAEVVSEALAVAGVGSGSIGYVETHGTGTALGDPIEVSALTEAFRRDGERRGRCALGAVKASVGHLDAAAGVTSLIKSVLALKHGLVPPSPHFRSPHPELSLDEGPFFVNTEPLPWEGEPRRAGVSSFGIGGTNAHVVLEQAPARERSQPGTAPLLPLSGRSPEAVVRLAHDLADRLEDEPGQDLGDVVHTLVDRRSRLAHRLPVVAEGTDDLPRALRSATEKDAVAAAAERPRLAFLFPGQGSQYAGMARRLYREEPVFAAEVDRCAGLFADRIGTDLRGLVLPEAGQEEARAEQLRRTEFTQPALFLVEYALARLWESWGVHPDVMAGHSIGEYAAACRAGVFSLETAVELVSARGRLVQAAPEGAMLSVLLPEEEVRRWLAELGGGAEVAAVNSPRTCAVSGPAEAVEALRRRLREAGVPCRRLRTSHAFHSSAMDGVLAPFTEVVRSVRLDAPRIPFLSNVTGEPITGEQATDPEYWARHLREPVLFSRITENLLSDPSTVLLEVGPGKVLTELAGQHGERGRTALTCLPRPGSGEDDRAHLLEALGGLWAAGVQVDRSALVPAGPRRAVHLPAHHVTGERYWVEPAPDAGTPAADRPAPSGEVGLHVPGWRSLPPRAPGGAEQEAALWVVLGDGVPLVRDLAAALEEAGAPVVRVAAQEALAPAAEEPRHTVSCFPGYFGRLLERLPGDRPGPVRVLHALALEPEPEGPLTAERVERARHRAHDSLPALAEALRDAARQRGVHIDLLCQGLHPVTGQETLRPEQALVTGPGTVLPQETTGLTCRTLDIAGTDPWAPAPQAVEAVRSVLGSSPARDELALRGRRWWRRAFEALDAGEGGSRLRDGGVYLITGGLGGVGLALAEQIAATVDRPTLALVGRSELPPEEAWPELAGTGSPLGERLRRLTALRRGGARVLVLRCDVTDTGRTAALVQEVCAAHGPLNGVVHAAGVPASGPLARASDRDTDGVLAPKVEGTLALESACAGQDLDFFLLCSSTTALLGGPGQSDYAAANAFLDGFAQQRRAGGTAPVASVAWGTWNGVGMAAALPRPDGTPRGRPTGHPLLRVVEEGENGAAYVCTFDTDRSWIVDDHRLMGHGLVPGTAYLELARAALAERSGGRELQLHDVLFLSPLIVPDGHPRSVLLTLEEADEGEKVRFSARSKDADGTWQDHVRGTASFTDRTEQVRDLDELRARCAPAEVLTTAEEIREALGADRFEAGRGPLEFRFGPRWQLLTGMHVGREHLFATMSLDEAFLGDLEDYPLHPALLDMAGGVFRVHAPDPYYLPLSYRRLRVLGPLTGTVHCAVSVVPGSDASGETLACDIELLDPEGRVLALVEGFSVKRVNDVGALDAQVGAAVAAAHESAGQLPEPLAALARGMDERAGKEAFARLMRAPVLPEHVLVCPDEPERLRSLARSIVPETLTEGIEPSPGTGARHPRPDTGTPFVAPSTERERAVADLWGEVLGVDGVGVHDDFFALGGHSLAAVRVNSGLRERLGAEVDLNEFFTDPTVARTVALLEAGAPEQEAPITPLERTGPEQETDVDSLSDEEVEAMLRQVLAEGGEEPR